MSMPFGTYDHTSNGPKRILEKIKLCLLQQSNSGRQKTSVGLSGVEGLMMERHGRQGVMRGGVVAPCAG
jgi:hypothetical protein